MIDARDDERRRQLTPGSVTFGLVVGLLAAWLAYGWITDTGRRVERAEQVRVVEAARGHLANKLGVSELDIVDPLATDRDVGKVYVYAAGSGWEVSGYYRRTNGDEWHAWLATLDAERELELLKVRDSDRALAERAREDRALEVLD